MGEQEEKREEERRGEGEQEGMLGKAGMHGWDEGAENEKRRGKI